MKKNFQNERKKLKEDKTYKRYHQKLMHLIKNKFEFNETEDEEEVVKKIPVSNITMSKGWDVISHKDKQSDYRFKSSTRDSVST